MSDSISVLFDGYWLVDGPPSGERVVRSMIEAWCESRPDDHVVVAVPWVSDALRQSFEAIGPNARSPEFVQIRPRIRNHGAWVLTQLGSQAAGRDVVISQNFTPLRTRGHNSRRYTFVHDVIYLDHPEWFSFVERIYLSMIGRSARKADVLLTSSNAERMRIGRNWPNQAAKLHSVGLAISRSLSQLEPEEPPSMHDKVKPFILAVGRLNVRKNVSALIEAYLSSAALCASFDLVVVGQRDGKAEAGRALADVGVRYLGHIPDSQLAWLYQACSVYVFPSLDEGFGLPLLEAHLFGARVAASDIPVFRELDMADRYFDPLSPAAIRDVLEDELLPVTERIPSTPEPDRDNWTDIVERIRGLMGAERQVADGK